MERNTDTRRFGHYLLIECISRGGVSEVYRAQLDAPGEQETVVLKLLTVNDSRQARSFGAAARLAATLKDPHIVPILEHGTLDGTPFLVMEHLDGVTVGELIRLCRAQDVSIPLEIVLSIMVQLMSALTVLHGTPIPGTGGKKPVHRDIKPQNLFLTRQGHLVLVDLDLVGLSLPGSEVEEGMLFGTVRYMSPEQASASLPLDHRSDLFSAGLVLVEMLTKCRVYDAPDIHSVLIEAAKCDCDISKQCLEDLHIDTTDSFYFRDREHIRALVSAMSDYLLSSNREDRADSAELVRQQLVPLLNSLRRSRATIDAGVWLSRLLEQREREPSPKLDPLNASSPWSPPNQTMEELDPLNASLPWSPPNQAMGELPPLYGANFLAPSSQWVPDPTQTGSVESTQSRGRPTAATAVRFPQNEQKGVNQTVQPTRAPNVTRRPPNAGQGGVGAQYSPMAAPQSTDVTESPALRARVQAPGDGLPSKPSPPPNNPPRSRLLHYHLATHLLEIHDIRMVCEDAGLDLAFLSSWGVPPVVIWQRALAEARRQILILALLSCVEQRCPVLKGIIEVARSEEMKRSGQTTRSKAGEHNGAQSSAPVMSSKSMQDFYITTEFSSFAMVGQVTQVHIRLSASIDNQVGGDKWVRKRPFRLNLAPASRGNSSSILIAVNTLDCEVRDSVKAVNMLDLQTEAHAIFLLRPTVGGTVDVIVELCRQDKSLITTVPLVLDVVHVASNPPKVPQMEHPRAQPGTFQRTLKRTVPLALLTLTLAAFVAAGFKMGVGPWISLRWIATALLAAVWLLLACANALEELSTVPIIGGIAGGLAMLACPVPDTAIWALVPAALDKGSLLWLARWSYDGVKRRISVKS